MTETPPSPKEAPSQAAQTPATPSLRRSSVLMATGSVASRVLGLLRTTLQVAAIGMATPGNAFAVANNLPNLVFMIIAGGVLNSILVPQLVKAMKHADGGQEFTDRVLTICLAGMAIVTIAATAAAPLLVQLAAGKLGGHPEAFGLATTFALVCLPQIFFYGVYGILGQILNARGRLGAFGWSPFVGNVVTIAGLLVFMRVWPHTTRLEDWTPQAAWFFAGSFTLGIVVQSLFLLVPLWRSGFRWRPRWGLRGVGLGATGRLAGWGVGALLVSTVGWFVTSRVSTTVDDLAANLTHPGDGGHFVAGFAVYNNALLLFTLPHNFVALSIISALYPRISQAAHDHDPTALRANYGRSIALPAAATIPAGAALIAFSYPICRAVFFRSPVEEVEAVAQVLTIMAFGIVAYSVDVVNQRFFYALERGRNAFVEQCILTATAVVITLSALAGPPERIVPTIAAGIVVSNGASALYGMVRIRALNGGHLGLARLLRTLVRVTLATTLAGLVAWGCGELVFTRLDGWAGSVLTVAVGGLVLALSYVVVARFLGVREVDDLLGPVLRRLGAPPPRRGRHAAP